MTARAAEELRIELPDLALAARGWGPGDGRPVLALHGWLDNAASFDRLAPLLSGARVAALDLAGHGLSDHRAPGAPYTFLDWACDALAACDALGWRRFSVVGHSLGAGLANTIAGAWPERVERVVLIDGFSPRTQPPDEAPARLAEYAARRAAARAASARVYADLDAAARRLTETIRGLSLESARVLAARGTRAVEGGLVWRRDPRVQVGPPLRLTREHMQAFLARVRCPTLFVRPLDGWPVEEATLRAVRETIAHARYATLEGGHHVHLERPDAVAELVAPFLAEAGTG